MTNIELYEALKPFTGDEGARLIAEAVPPARDAATKGDFAALRNDMAQMEGRLEARMAAGFQQIRLELAEFKAETRRWMLQFFVPLWIGVYGTIAAVTVSVVLR